VLEAFESGLSVEFVIVPGDQHPDPEIAGRCDSDGIRLFGLAPETFASLSDARTPQPALAVVTLPELGLDDRFRSENAMYLVLVDISDPGNVGTLIRTAEATGCAGVVVTSRTADVTSPKVVRASAGSMLRMPIAEVEGEALGDTLEQLGAQVVGTAMDGVAYDQISIDGQTSVALLLGSEAHGLDASARAIADHVVSIPMYGKVESLNVATAGAVLAFDLAAKRRGN
jgi:TrmH family RNA methyltransferase